MRRHHSDDADRGAPLAEMVSHRAACASAAVRSRSDRVCALLCVARYARTNRRTLDANRCAGDQFGPTARAVLFRSGRSQLPHRAGRVGFGLVHPPPSDPTVRTSRSGFSIRAGPRSLQCRKGALADRGVERGRFRGWIVAALWRWREAPAWLLIPGLTLAAVAYYGALDGGANLFHIDFGCRYSFVPQALFGLSLLAFATTRHGVVRWIATAGIVWIISTGFLEYFKPSPSYAHGPDWANEVAVWQANPAYHPAVWAPFVADWQIDLSKP